MDDPIAVKGERRRNIKKKRNAAAASTHNLILVTRNESDFTPAQISFINPWEN
jgi:predicted nucleic acid-binding protein